ncbi:hypothetical protein B0J18DRAFT_174806 [Chaetomium sp. MPI-SDFR-AT-0129]|nr:hypothetical protein B0J18DRAFT_174806 [Chaetomium sp. MPI-SDFR-AT-0129]
MTQIVSFTVFNDLPLELRQLIWHFALPEDEPEVLIVRADHLDIKGRKANPEPMLVQTVFPALMHTCRESREYTRNLSGIIFQYTPPAGCDVPYRLFRPELDTAFWDENVQNSLWASYFEAGHDKWLAQLRHLAVPSATAFVGQHMTECIMEHCPRLRTLSVVFPDSTDYNRVQTRFEEPTARRARLVEIPGDHARRTMVVFDTWHYDPTYRIPLYDFLLLFCSDLNDHRNAIYAPHDVCLGQGWTIRTDDDGTRPRCFLQTFVEWNGGRWVEACGGRKLTSPGG